MKAVVIVVAAVACLFGGTMADDRVAAVFTGSEGSTGGLLGCQPLSAKAPLVRFQAVRTGGVEYSRVSVHRTRMRESDVTVTDLGSLTFLQCVKAANKKQMDAFSFETGQCVGYKIGDGICPCTKGDLVLYRLPSAIRDTSSAKTLTVAKERAEAAPLLAGYVRKIIYPTVSMTGNNFQISSSSCEDVLKTAVLLTYRPFLLHTVNGKCYHTIGFSKLPCTSCAGTATEVIVKEPIANQTYLLSNCGRTITLPTYNVNEYISGIMTPVVLYSHEGYGCIPYPDPVSDDNCEITLISPLVNDKIHVSTSIGDIDSDASPGTTCDGDELYVIFDSAQGSTCKKKGPLALEVVANSVTIRFQRKPAYNTGSVNKGFALRVFRYIDTK